MARYIKQNPARPKMLQEVEDYPYSSARAHINGIRDAVLSDLLFEENQRKDYAQFIRMSISEEEIEEIRQFTMAWLPLGKAEFVGEMEAKFQR